MTTDWRARVGLVATLVLAACGSAAGEGVESGGLATLTEDTGAEAVTEGESQADPTPEESVLAFADCMRENGVPDFQDPIVAADGSVEFVGAGSGGGEPADSDALFEAFEGCGDLLEDVAFGPGGTDFDLTELQDTLLLFAECLRDNGLEADDPDISAGFGGNQGDDAVSGPGAIGPAALFGDAIDFDDPDVQKVFEACAEKVNLQTPGGN